MPWMASCGFQSSEASAGGYVKFVELTGYRQVLYKIMYYLLLLLCLINDLINTKDCKWHLVLQFGNECCHFHYPIFI